MRRSYLRGLRVTIPKYKVLSTGTFPREQIDYFFKFGMKYLEIHKLVFDLPIGGAALPLRFTEPRLAFNAMHALKMYYLSNKNKYPFAINIYKGGNLVFITKDFK